MDSRQQLEEDLKLVSQAPNLLRLAKEVYDYLPPTKVKKQLYQHVADVRKDLIKLDVLLQDIEWSVSEARVKRMFDLKSRNQ